MSGRPLEILVVDDESEVRETLRRALVGEGHDVLAVRTGEEAIDHASTRGFDVVLLDVALGDGPGGFEVCRRLRERRNAVPIIMITALDSEADAVMGLEAGADDYICKPFGLAELRSRIRAVLRRGSHRGELGEVITRGPVTMDQAARTVAVDGRNAALTFSEFELLRTLMHGAGRLFNRQELLVAIWGDDSYRDPRAIDVHVRHLREKIEQKPERPVLIVTVRGIGYRLECT